MSISHSALTKNQVSWSSTTGSSTGSAIESDATDFTYDSYGNVTRAVTTRTDSDANSTYNGATWVTTTVNTPASDIANWCLSLFSQIQVTYDGSLISQPITRTVSMTPDTAKCHYTQTTVEPGSQYAVTSTLSFDSFGNTSGNTVTGNSMASRTTTVNWGTTGQFPIAIKDPVGNSLGANGYQTVVGYDYNLGLPTSRDIQSGDGSVNNTPPISWQYDAYGRKTRETRSDGTYTTWGYAICSGCDPLARMAITEIPHDSAGSGVTTTIRYLDELDRPYLDHATLEDGTTVWSASRSYDTLGRLVSIKFPYRDGGTSVGQVSYSYDALNRLTQTQKPTSATNSTVLTTKVTYTGDKVSTTDAKGNVTTKTISPAGTLLDLTDPGSYEQFFKYDGFGSVTKIYDNSHTLMQASYAYGIAPFATDVTDIDMDVSVASGQHRHFTINALGEVTAWGDANGNTSSALYDALSRPVSRTEADLSTSWTWGSNPANHEVGQLTTVSAGAYSEQRTFDAYGRLLKMRITAGTQCDTNSYCDYDFGYNSAGLLDHLLYPQSPSAYRFGTQYGYQNGLVSQIADYNSPTTLFWKANSNNALGQVTQETLGNGIGAIQVNRSMDAVTGLVNSIQAGVGGGAALQNESYLYDAVGNVTQRLNAGVGLTENFYYDTLNRLTSTSGATNLQIGYDATGNITNRNDVAGNATWTYSSTHIHQVLTAGDSAHTYAYDNNGNVRTRNGSSIGWTTYNYPASISSGTETVAFTYGPDRQRVTQTYTSSNGTETTYYLGQLTEKIINGSNVDFRYYIFKDARLFFVRDRTSAGSMTDSYLLTDHQGSVSAVATSSGAPYVEESYDAFGNRRNPATWSGPPSSQDVSLMASVTRQGYTGQTVLGTMGLNHMNGRVQDAITGRFLSADPLVADPLLTQSYNRYSYVYNNPLTFLDPTGFVTCPAPTDSAIHDSSAPTTLEQVTVSADCPKDSSGGSSAAVTAGGGDERGQGGRSNQGDQKANGQPLEEVVVTAFRLGANPAISISPLCLAPPLTTEADRQYDPSEPNYHEYHVDTVIEGLTKEQAAQLENLWRNGPNAGPGISSGQLDYQEALLATTPWAPDANWVYIRPTNNGWVNVTSPGHLFYPGTVTNTVTWNNGVTTMSTVGVGVTPHYLQNIALGTAFFKASQLEALWALLGGPRIQIGSAGSCNKH